MIKAKVLFLCTENSCRTQMVEAFLRHLAGDRFEIVSAGADPGRIDPEAISAMRELGIEMSGQTPKDVTRFSRTALHLRYYLVRPATGAHLPDISRSHLAEPVGSGKPGPRGRSTLIGSPRP